MRLVHTSDWHLGRTLHGESLLEPQRAFLEWLCELAVDRRADAVLVAGDVYDRAVPSTDAVALLNDALVSLARAGIAVVLTSGNHDSAIRLGFGAELQQAAGIHLRTRIADLDKPITLTDGDGAVGIYGIPYLLPDAAMAELDAERSHTSVLRKSVERILRDAADRAITRTVAIAHAFVVGGLSSDSERDIRVGGVGEASSAVFDGLTYAALGHLHGQQRIAARVRYSGSPLAFSFSERAHTKSVSVIEIDGAGNVEVETIPTPVPRRLCEITGRLEDLLARADGELRQLADAWVKVVLTDDARPNAPMERLREKWPHTLVLDFRPERGRPDVAADLARVRAGIEPVEICAAFVEWVDSTRPTPAQRDTFRSVIAAVERAELSA